MGIKGAAPAKAGPYGRIYGPWFEELAGAKLSGTERLVMEALLMHPHFTVNGQVWGALDHKGLSDLTKATGGPGVAVNTISNAAQCLVKRRFLAIKHRGHRGLCTEYWIMPGRPWPDIEPGSPAKAKTGRAPEPEVWEPTDEPPDFGMWGDAR